MKAVILFTALSFLYTCATSLPVERIDESSPKLARSFDQASGISSSNNSNTNPAHINAASTWFLPNLDHTSGAVRGYVPNLQDSNGNPVYNYPVYVAVASGDAQGFVNALYSNGPSGGSRDNMWLAGEPRVVYLAPGTYTLSSTVYIDTDTVIIGDANNPPTIKAAAGFSGDFLLVGGQGGTDGTGGEVHFSVSIRNVILDTTANSATTFTALSWRVAQNCALNNIQINMPQGRHTGIYLGQGSTTANSATTFTALSWRVAQNCALNNIQINMPQGRHTGIYLGQGSTTSVGDVKFSYGALGLQYSGHQQADLKNLQFTYCTVGISIDSGFAIDILAPVCNTVGRCIVYNSGSPWVSVVDGVSTNSGDFFTSNQAYPNFMLENISKDTTNSNMVTVGGTVKVGGVTSIGQYIYGNTYGANPVYQTNPSSVTVKRPSVLAPNGKYPIFSAPQYAGKTTSDVINLKDSSQNGGYTLHGDGSTDDTAALQGALNTAASKGKIGYLPFGIYKVTSTITVPSGSQIYGEAWSTISGYGSAFSNVNSPTPIVRVGAPGSTGTAVMQDLRFTVGQSLPGAIILQVNMAAKKPGDVAIFNSLITVGGTRDTSLNCQSEANCIGAYIGLHLASGSNAYVDNFWSWVADHSSDNSSNGVNSANKGGILVESQAGTWLVGIASEHWWLYNLNYNNAQNVFTSFFQSETNYRQGSGAQVLPPAPFTATSSDPNFAWCSGGDDLCRMTVAQYYQGGSSSNIWHYAAGSWNFFGGTQTNMNVINNQISNGQLHGYTDHDATYLFRLPDGKQFGNGGSDGFGGSWGSLLASLASQS